jgi:hypothetical protein
MQLTLDLNQRWCAGRASYRPPSECIRTAEYDVAEIPDDVTARDFVQKNHYSKTYPAARFRVGLYHRGDLAGVAVFSHPCSNAVLTNVFPGPVATSVELGRFVLLDRIPGNGESWFLARCFEVISSRGITGVVSFSDPQPRQAENGTVVHSGHYGCIYQSSNGIYLGRGTARTLKVLPDGRVFSDRAAQKIRGSERGWRYAAAQLEAYGAPAVPKDPEARIEWLTSALAKITRKLRHRGNFRYCWALNKSLRAELPKSLPFPKTLDPLQ